MKIMITLESREFSFLTYNIHEIKITLIRSEAKNLRNQRLFVNVMNLIHTYLWLKIEGF